MPDTPGYTAAEAAFVLRVPIRAVKKAFDLGPVRPILQLRSGASVRVIDWADLFYLFAAHSLAEHLAPAARIELHTAVRRMRPHAVSPDIADPAASDEGQPVIGDEVRFGRFRVAVADLVDELRHRTAVLAELQGKVAFAADGKPVVGARGVRVHRIAALLRGGLSLDAVMEEFPYLSRAAIETARDYAQVRPARGRPFPRTTAARARRGAGLEPPDEVLGEDDGRN